MLVIELGADVEVVISGRLDASQAATAQAGSADETVERPAQAPRPVPEQPATIATQ